MTLVVARIAGERAAVASDTMLTKHQLRLPHHQGVIKSCLLPGDLCVSFANSPELAARDFARFAEHFPLGTGFRSAVTFFEESSASTGNDYIIARSLPPKLVKIVDGHALESISKTQWIGDRHAYEQFREYEAKQRKSVHSGRAISNVMFMDELSNSPASDLYSTMRQVIGDTSVTSTGGFICVVSNRDRGFRHSVYSDMLYNWPDAKSDDFIFQIEDRIDFGASGENVDYAVAQISTSFSGLNCVAFYLLSGKKLFLFSGDSNGLANSCQVMRDVEPGDIQGRLNSAVGADLRWLLTIMSAANTKTQTIYRGPAGSDRDRGVALSMFCHANTFPPKGR